MSQMNLSFTIPSLLILLAVLSSGFSGCQSQEKHYQVFESIAFDTTVTVTICPQDGLDYAALFSKISERILAIEKAASLYLSDSELSQLNQTGTLQASDEFIKILQVGIQAGEQTQGSFDISIQPLWDFYQGGSAFSSIEDVLKLVDYQKIQTKGALVSLPPNMKLSFNGFIQGYVTDAVFQTLKESGVQHALINGGEYRAIGQDYHSPWQITITGDSGQEIAQLEMADSEALAVTAGYGYVFTGSPTQASHLFDPKNQKQVSNKSTHVVRATTATQADIYATVAAVVDENRWSRITPSNIELLVFK